MATRKQILPSTMIAPDTGEVLTRGVRPFVVSYKGESVSVELPGYYPAGDGDGVVVGDDMAVVDEALRGLKEKIEGLPSPATIRRVRLRLICRSARPACCSRSARTPSINMSAGWSSPAAQRASC